MGLRINTNVPSLIAQHRLGISKHELEETQNRLATGSRIVNSKDDAAGLAISESLRSAIRCAGQNIKNVQNGFFLLQTADGSINEITNVVIRMKELAVQAASDTNGDKERSYLDGEYQQLKDELNRIAVQTRFNGRPLLNGEGGTIEIQVGPGNNNLLDRIRIATKTDVTLSTLGLRNFNLTTADDARRSLEPTDSALDVIATARGAIGAAESRLQTSTNSLQIYEENLTGAFSQIRDADMAAETSTYAKYNILTQAGVAILSQANSAPQLVLKLLNA